jgi:hypothetical protein
MALVNEVGPGCAASTRVNKQHRGFGLMADMTVKTRA